MLTVADETARALRTAGVRAVFGVPGGGSNLDLIEALRRIDLPFILTATETGAAIAAIAQAEITGRPGACLATLGPGVSAAANGVACALLERAPLLFFSDAHADEAVPGLTHQTLAQRAFLWPIVKGTGRFGAGDAAPLLARAIALSLAPPAGPVYLEQASPTRGSDPEAETARLANGFVNPSLSAAVPVLDRAALTAMLGASRRPLLLVGLGARLAADAVRAFCERHRVPAMVTYKAKGVVPDGHPWFGGVFTHAAIEQALIEESDLLIGVGLDPVELLPRPWSRPQPIIYCGPWAVPASHVPFAHMVIDEPGHALDGFATSLPSSTWHQEAVAEYVHESRRRVALETGDGLTPAGVVRIAAERLAADGRVTVDSGAHMLPATMLWPVAEPGGLLISNGLSTMGFALPAAIGAALVDRPRRVVALIGDGGLLMCAGELRTLARERLPVLVLVFNDASLSLIELKQQQRRLPAAGVALGGVDFAALAESCGVAGFSAGTEAQLVEAIDRATALAGPALIDVRVDRASYGDTFRAIRGG